LGNSVGNILSILLNPNTYNAEMRHIARKTEYQGLAASNNIVTYSSVIVAAVGMYLYRTEYTLKYRRWKKYLMFVLVILVIMVFEQQRTNLLFIPLSFAVVYIVSDRKNQHYKFLTVSFLGGIGFIVFYNLMPLMSSINSISRIINTVDMFLNGQNILSNRSFLYGRAIEMWKAKPVWGNGWYQFFLSNNGILTVGTYSHAHNMIYELLADGGIVGLVIGLTPLMYTFIENVRLLTKCKGRKDKYEDKFRFTLLVQIFFIFDSFLHVTFYHSFIMMIYLLEIIIFYSVKEEFYKECSR